MIWLLLIFLTPYPYRLVRMFWPSPAPSKPPETWAERRKRVAFENRCHELGQRLFATTYDGDNNGL